MGSASKPLEIISKPTGCSKMPFSDCGLNWSSSKRAPFNYQPKAVLWNAHLGLQPKYKVSNQKTNTTNISKLGSKPPRFYFLLYTQCWEMAQIPDMVSASFLVILRDFYHGHGWCIWSMHFAPPESLPTSIKAHALQSTVHCWRVADLRGWMDHELINQERKHSGKRRNEWTPCVHTERVSYEFHEKSHSVPLNPIKSH